MLSSLAWPATTTVLIAPMPLRLPLRHRRSAIIIMMMLVLDPAGATTTIIIVHARKSYKRTIILRRTPAGQISSLMHVQAYERMCL